MNKNIAVLVIGILLFTLPVLTASKINSYNYTRANRSSEKCSSELEGLKLCVENPTISVNSNEPVRIKLLWVNSLFEEREIMRAGSYFVKVTDEQGKQLDPVFQQKIKARSTTMDDYPKKLARGSYVSIHLDAYETRTEEIRLTENYDYDLLKKSKYSVNISKTIPSLEKGKTIEFVVDDIEIILK